MMKLRLGPIDDDKPVKVHVELPGPVHRDLLAYAKAHAEETGLTQPFAIERLIAPMLARFMASDRGFARKSRDAR
jgi:hypothetical protein